MAAIRSLQRARQAETLVADWLESKGFSLVAKNLRLGYLEIDVVARRLELIIVVEVRVRARGSFTTAFGSVSRQKQLHVRRAASRLWRRRYAHDPSAERLRIDVATVDFDGPVPTLEYCAGAF